ncbi:hypothetical protein [Clostridium sp.]|uniref:hypothetical protein n=1 Tax=Clostridium sp. TaxID=1506 RepID=UPI00399516D2
MRSDIQEITLYKNLKRRLKESESFNRFEMEPVEESKELALIEEERNGLIEIDLSDISYEIDTPSSNIIDVECENYDVEKYEQVISELKKEVITLKNELNDSKCEIEKLKSILTKEQQLHFNDDIVVNKLTKTEKLLLDKRDELYRRRNLRKKSWFKQVLG